MLYYNQGKKDTPVKTKEKNKKFKKLLTNLSEYAIIKMFRKGQKTKGWQLKMSSVRKEKSKFIITLDSGKETYFDFADECYYGVSGRKVKEFGKEAKKYLSERCGSNMTSIHDEYDFFVDYLYRREYGLYWGHIPPNIIESVYSIYSTKYKSKDILYAIALVVYKLGDSFTKQTYKVLNASLTSILEGGNYITTDLLLREITRQLYPELPTPIQDILLARDFSRDVKETIILDKERIAFRYEHDCWGSLMEYDSSSYLFGSKQLLSRYIELCNYLHKERTYKDLIGSVGKMTKEADLLLAETVGDYQSIESLHFDNDLFSVLVPTTAEEFQAEADYQRNCVFTAYYPRVLKHQTHIVFIRKKDEADLPYITCEVTNEGIIKQYFARFNKKVNDEMALQFKKDYQKFLTEKFNKKEGI